ncbi:hypothetical protein [Streptomyces sp. NPDC051577]|uniref:hypothetical protein n=1 Tax=Streptomyces sp. NPDC051577 TaxID=3155166 RepID=UPI00341FD63D
MATNPSVLPSVNSHSPNGTALPRHRVTAHCDYVSCRPAVLPCRAPQISLISATGETLAKLTPDVYYRRHRFMGVRKSGNRSRTATTATIRADTIGIDAPTLPAGLDPEGSAPCSRDRPGFGALADRSVVYLRRRWEGEDGLGPADYLMEVGSDGRRLRQVELGGDGTAVKSGPDDWAYNPPVVDIIDPDLAGMEIGRDEFEAQWLRAHHMDTGQ